MKVFISWSGSPSRELAEIFRKWIPSVVQSVVPFVSSQDAQKGARWAGELAQELEGTDYGVLCITPDNVDSPWINFEAGALSKVIDRAKVAPVLFGLRPSDITNPLVQFQCTTYERDDLLKLFRGINTASDNGLDPAMLESTFDIWWSKFDTEISKALNASSTANGNVRGRDFQDMIVEILGLLREHQKTALESEVSRIWQEMGQGLRELRSLLAKYDEMAGNIRPTTFGYAPLTMNTVKGVSFTELSFIIGQLIQAAEYAAIPGNTTTSSFVRIRGLISLAINRLSPLLDMKIVEAIRQQTPLVDIKAEWPTS